MLASIISQWFPREGSMPSRATCLWVIGFLLLLTPSAAKAQPSVREQAVTRENLCVTEGAIEPGPGNRLSVNAEKMRAYVNTWTSQAIDAQFTYVGPTAEESRLGSGEIRRQFGLKLHAQNACNLVYAMWRIESESKIVVSVKRNPSQATSSECGNRGYQNIKPRRAAPVPDVRPGETHSLRAELNGDEMRVFVDNREAWEGSIGPEAQDLSGPVGIRSDNVRLTLDLKAGAYVGIHPNFKLACKSGPGASD